jgi:hypothetical protein
MDEITYVTPNYDWPEAAQDIIGRSGCDLDICPSPQGVAKMKSMEPLTIWPSHVIMTDKEREAATQRAPIQRARLGKSAGAH